jgi:hypothetical protein
VVGRPCGGQARSRTAWMPLVGVICSSPFPGSRRTPSLHPCRTKCCFAVPGARAHRARSCRHPSKEFFTGYGVISSLEGAAARTTGVDTFAETLAELVGSDRDTLGGAGTIGRTSASTTRSAPRGSPLVGAAQPVGKKKSRPEGRCMKQHPINWPKPWLLPKPPTPSRRRSDAQGSSLQRRCVRLDR